jgi:hypothetical protein
MKRIPRVVRADSWTDAFAESSARARSSHRISARFLMVPGLLGLATISQGQSVSRPIVPDAIKAPADEHVVLQTRATGVQIYVCRRATNGNLEWALSRPDAQLRDEKGSVVGYHYAGPAWKLSDGSVVQAKVAGQVAAPDADSIPWLLLTASGHSGTGMLGRVTSVQRIHTVGGRAPLASDCNSSRVDHEVRRSYTADYYFYAAAKTRE